MKEEIFKEIKGFPRYQISNFGRVVTNFETISKFLKPQKDKMGYLHVRLYTGDESLGRYKNGAKIPKLEKVHRLVALTFVKKPDTVDYVEVNHKDSDKTNNHYDNLEWVTRSQNILHSYGKGNRDGLTGHLREMNQKPVKVTYRDGTVEYFVSTIHCALSLNTAPATLTTRLIKQDKGGEPIWGKLNLKVERVDKLPKSKEWTMIAGIEEKILQFQQKYFPRNEEMREKRRKYARLYRERKKKRLAKENNE